jgi:WD40 repeat protein
VVVSGSGDKTVKLWDTVTGAALQTLEGYSTTIKTVAFSLDGKLVVSGSGKTVIVWDAMGAAVQTLEGHSAMITSVAFSLDGKVIYTLFVSNNWVAEGQGRILWLPPDYRPTSIAVRNGIIVLGHSSGSISFLGFIQGSKLINTE